MTLSDARFLALSQWVQLQFPQGFSLTMVSGDASFRRYFRVQSQNNFFIVVDSPPELTSVMPFVELAKSYTQLGIKVPEIIAFSEEDGFVLQTDLGDEQLGSRLNADNVTSWYQQALLLLPQVLQLTQSANTPLPLYDAEFVKRELDIFNDWLLGQYLALPIDNATQQMLDGVFVLLIDNAITQPKGGMHRDFHSRNLMVKNSDLWVIDFQDSVVGPVTYDAVSLLRDCYVRWPEKTVTELMTFHYQLLLRHHFLPVNTEFSDYRRWFDLMGLQRHIKAVGIFARLHLRDNKSAYLKDIPLTLEYLRDISLRYNQLIPFHHWITTQLIPAFSSKNNQNIGIKL